MRVLLVNVPHPSIGSRIPDDHLPPLGLLAIGGPLIDDGHAVRLIDAEFGPMSIAEVVSEATGFAPDAVLFGHSGSTSGHPVIAAVACALVKAMPRVLIVMAASSRPTIGAKSCTMNPMSARSCAAKVKRPRGV